VEEDGAPPPEEHGSKQHGSKEHGSGRPFDQEHDDTPDEIEASPSPGTHTALPPKIEAWRRRSAAGAILTGFALGLQQALEKRKEEPAIVMETSGNPPRDLPVESEFEYGRPRQSTIQIRPWLLNEADPAGGSTADPEPEDGSEPPRSGPERP
jgi:hypothetical protein